MSIIIGTQENFQKEVLESDVPVLVDFNATWCPPCRALHPILEAMSNESKNYKIVSVDIDEEDILAAEHEISSIPCLIVYKNGEEAERRVGLLPRKRIEKMLEK